MESFMAEKSIYRKAVNAHFALSCTEFHLDMSLSLVTLPSLLSQSPCASKPASLKICLTTFLPLYDTTCICLNICLFQKATSLTFHTDWRLDTVLFTFLPLPAFILHFLKGWFFCVPFYWDSSQHNFRLCVWWSKVPAYAYGPRLTIYSTFFTFKYALLFRWWRSGHPTFMWLSEFCSTTGFLDSGTFGAR